MLHLNFCLFQLENLTNFAFWNRDKVFVDYLTMKSKEINLMIAGVAQCVNTPAVVNSAGSQSRETGSIPTREGFKREESSPKSVENQIYIQLLNVNLFCILLFNMFSKD